MLISIVMMYAMHMVVVLCHEFRDALDGFVTSFTASAGFSAALSTGTAATVPAPATIAYAIAVHH